MRNWITLPYPVCLVKFERLVKDPYGCLKEIIKDFDIEAPPDVHMLEACDRQSFATKKKWLERTNKKLPLGKDVNLRHMRKGEPGDWKNHFTEKDKRMAQTFFSKMMVGLGYTP